MSYNIATLSKPIIFAVTPWYKTGAHGMLIHTYIYVYIVITYMCIYVYKYAGTAYKVRLVGHWPHHILQIPIGGTCSNHVNISIDKL